MYSTACSWAGLSCFESDSQSASAVSGLSDVDEEWFSGKLSIFFISLIVDYWGMENLVESYLLLVIGRGLWVL